LLFPQWREGILGNVLKLNGFVFQIQRLLSISYIQGKLKSVGTQQKSVEAVGTELKIALTEVDFKKCYFLYYYYQLFLKKYCLHRLDKLCNIMKSVADQDFCCGGYINTI